MAVERIIDFHTHAFPDDLAPRAIVTLEAQGNISAHLDGTVASLLRSMDLHGIEQSVIATVATRPDQFDPIFKWCREIRSDRIIPFPSVHPEDPLSTDRVRRIREAGMKGVKLHPYYQGFILDDERLFPLYHRISREGLILVVHAGFDIAFPRVERADPARILRVATLFPDLRLVATHMGSWGQWAKVREHLIGRNIYIETSFALELMGREEARDMILGHPVTHILFGSDSPWADQGESVALLTGLELGHDTEQRILRENALGILGPL
jgi:hypothetical protein